MLSEILTAVVFSAISVILAYVIILLPIALVMRINDVEKISAYECGFQPFEDARRRFDIRFYLVAIAFLIFDLEIIFLFPWCLQLTVISQQGYFVVYVFLLILLLGFLYEWKKGGLDWE